MRTSIAEKHTNHLVAGLGPLKSSSQYFILINLRVFSLLNRFASFLACCLLSLLAGNRKSWLSRVCNPLQLQNPVFDTSRLLPRFQSVSCPGHFPRTCLPRFLEKFVRLTVAQTPFKIHWRLCLINTLSRSVRTSRTAVRTYFARSAPLVRPFAPILLGSFAYLVIITTDCPIGYQFDHPVPYTGDCNKQQTKHLDYH